MSSILNNWATITNEFKVNQTMVVTLKIEYIPVFH